jgi:hypothetical protein
MVLVDNTETSHKYSFQVSITCTYETGIMQRSVITWCTTIKIRDKNNIKFIAVPLVQRSPTVCLIVCVIAETPKGALCSSWEPKGK